MTDLDEVQCTLLEVELPETQFSVNVKVYWPPEPPRLTVTVTVMEPGFWDVGTVPLHLLP